MIAVIRVAISRSACSAVARRRISTADRSRAWIRRELWIAIAAWWASASASPTWSGPNASALDAADLEHAEERVLGDQRA